MHTPLFISDRYCLSLGDLKSIIQVASKERGQLYDDILIVIQDGILEQWLLEGTSEEQVLAKELHNYEVPRHALNKLCLELDVSPIM